ncbi:jg5297 [Pararge aegeria aegeria]|uniref:Jg5297 protein n=1 Tax=Pararge aegeria aegeria TaxID=348720 RepID=A0A8S4R7P4_9NEOP|nr:jg5297 [Pararge aegeria aegeria]
MVVCNSGDSKLDAAVTGWLKHDKNPVTRQEVLDDIANSKWDKLRKTMLKRQKFGTAGLRGRMGAGYMCMNDVVVLQTAQGLCSYLQKVCNQSQLRNGVVVGFDGRYNSKRFAELTAKVFVSSSIPVQLFSEVCPTPFVSFATILYGAAAGVMVTASHNPKEDNGYKVYWGNGSQVITPHDDNILEEIWTCLNIPEDHWNIEEIRNHDQVKDCFEQVTSKYMEYIKSCLHEDVLEDNRKAGISTVYSAMHGVGYDSVVRAFEAANLKDKIPLFAFEEAIGYMCSPRVPDKDGVSAAVQVASLASNLYSKGSSLVDQLQALYVEYGFHVSHNAYFLIREPTVVQKIFSRIRNFHGPGLYPKNVGTCEVTFLNDFSSGVRLPEEVNGEGHLRVLGTGLDQDYTSGEMIFFQCSNGLSVTIRTSGTEPKLKYYTELVCNAPTIAEQDEKKIFLEQIVKEFIDELIQPKENGLIG